MSYFFLTFLTVQCLWAGFPIKVVLVLVLVNDKFILKQGACLGAMGKVADFPQNFKCRGVQHDIHVVHKMVSLELKLRLQFLDL